MPLYRIDISTGGAGTDASVYLTLYGDEASSGELRVDNDGTRFLPGAVDTLWHDLSDLGEVGRLRIGHDGGGSHADWYLRQIDVRCTDSGRSWHFPCCRWLARDRDDGETERVFDRG